MDTLSVIIAVFLGVLVVAFSVLLLLAIIFNVRVGSRYREPLAEKLKSLRLSKMLTALGIDTYVYLRKESIVTIHTQMSHCFACANTDVCDDSLANDNIDINSINFCNNESSLKDLLARKGATE